MSNGTLSGEEDGVHALRCQLIEGVDRPNCEVALLS